MLDSNHTVAADPLQLKSPPFGTAVAHSPHFEPCIDGPSSYPASKFIGWRHYTLDDTPPSWVKNHEPGVVMNVATAYDYTPNAGGVTLRITAALSEPGRVFFAAYAVPASIDVLESAVNPLPLPLPPPGDVRACAMGGAKVESAYQAVACIAGAVDVPGADGAITIDIPGLDSETTFFVYATAEDLENLRPPHPFLLAPRDVSYPSTANLQRAVTRVTPCEGVVTVDISPPRWNHGGVGGGGDPTATAVTSTDLTVSFGLSEPGDVFWVVILGGQNIGGYSEPAAVQSQSAPTAADVMRGTGAGGGEHVASGTSTVTSSSANTNTTIHISGSLMPRVSYDVYLTARDVAGNVMVWGPMQAVTVIEAVDLQTLKALGEIFLPSEISNTLRQPSCRRGRGPLLRSPKALESTHGAHCISVGGAATVRVTTRDDTPPAFRDDSPSMLVGGRVAQVAAAADEGGRLHFIIVAADATAPTSTEVRAGTAAGGAVPLVASSVREAQFMCRWFRFNIFWLLYTSFRGGGGRGHINES